MKLIPERFKHQGLFITLFLFTVLVVVTVSATITWQTLRMAEQFFIERFSITNSKVMNQVKDSFESFNYSIVVASNNLLQSGSIKNILTEEHTNYESMSAFFTLGQQMNRIQSIVDTHEVSILITGINGITYSTDRTYWPIKDEELKKSHITIRTYQEPKRLMYHFDYRSSITGYTEDNRFIVASRALREPISGEIYGAMYFAIQEKELKRFYSNYTSPGNDVFLLDAAGTIVSSSDTSRIGQTAEDLLGYTREIRRSGEPYIIGDFNGKEQILLMDYLPSYDMYLFNVIDKETAFGDIIDKKEIVQIAVLITLVALLVVFFTSRRMTTALSRLARQISSTSKQDFQKYVDVAGTYETRKIGYAINSMLDELHNYVDQLMITQKEKRNAELAALQQQINPHFLYNTLTSIKFMVLQGSKEEATETIHALISLLQNTIGNISETVTVEQEVENLKNYVLINQKRYGDRIKVNYFVAPDCEEHPIPKLILQPFMENSFFHGFNHKQEGYVNVLIWRDGERLLCEVADNGDGMELDEYGLPDPKRKQQMFSGIGVQNVHQRIQLIYGDEYGVNIDSEPGEGTTVRITLPFNQ
ncbi:sensor histidine kinase [Bacillus sp. FJAT-27251]|uniref:sensor histidine kinase n=1 Tax=Bacillus sp. FJAT-27251 TaxID=1684142 RepID=UPI0006A75EA5|nr:sensor histidine kinase [Bacillus sp. FJAT-27251]